MAAFYFLTGLNAFALQQEVQRWKKGFLEKHGDTNLLTIQGNEQTPQSLMDALSVMPFIGDKRLVICEGVPKIDKDELKKVIAEQHPDTIFAIVDGKPDKRLSIVKEIEKQAEVKKYEELSPAELKRWMGEYVKLKNKTIAADAMSELLMLVGNDQWMLHSELNKLVAAAETEITKELVEKLAVPSGAQVVWKLTDLLGNQRTADALSFFRDQVSRGEDPYGMWVILLGAVRNIAGIRACLDDGISDDKRIAEVTGAHPFSIRGMKPLARALPMSTVKDLVKRAADADIALKSGGYRYTAERPEELLALAERLIVGCR